MKKLFLLTLLLSLALSLFGCSNKDIPSDTADNDLKIDAYEAKISYCMELISSLKDDLADAREEAYIAGAEYEEQIYELEQQIAALLEQSNKQQTQAPSDAEAPTSAPDTKAQDFEYRDIDGGIRITKYIGSDTDVEIPQAIDGKEVLEIGENAFFSSDVEAVRIPNGVRTLDWFAFYGCTSLKTVILPASVICIEYGAFDYTHPSLRLICPADSYAEAYAKSWGFDTEIE